MPSKQTLEIELEAQNEELRRTQDELFESRDRFRELYDLAPVGYVTLDQQSRVREANTAAAELLGLSVARLEGRPLVAFMREADAETFYHHLRAVFAIRSKQHCRVTLEVSTDHPPMLRLIPVRIDSIAVAARDTCRSVIIDESASVRESSARKQVERELWKSEARFREIAEHLADGVVLTGRDPLRIAYANPACAAIYGRSVEELAENVGEWTDWIHDDDRERVVAAYGRFIAGGEFDEEARLVRPDGEARWVRARIFALPSDAESVRRDLTLVQDTTAIRQREERLRQAEKMEAVGALASGVAHDFNNVLQAVLGCINVARREGTDPGTARAYLEHAADAAMRGRDLADRLMTFSRRRDHDPAPVELDEVVGSIAALVDRLVTEQVTLDLRLSAPLAAIEADRVQIEQILMNLAANARDAMPLGGRLTIQTEAIVADAAYANRHGVEPGSEWVRLVVADSGTGMDEQTIARIFEPFFTTKGVGRGTGLGLSTVFAITQQLEGHVDVTSEPGRGTTFAFGFPRCAARAFRSRVDRSELPRFRGTVLVVEDAPLVRITVRHDLEELGLRVLVADDVEQAQELFDAHRDAIDLVLSDVLLPTMPGPRLVALLRGRFPALRVLFMSATPERAGVDAPVLRKPFDVHELAVALERVLGPEHTVGRVTVSKPVQSHGRSSARAFSPENGACIVLLVEDDATSRMVIADVLEADGFVVLAAASLQQARELAERTPSIALLLTDVNLPDGSGTTFARALRATHPDVRVILMSGAVEAPAGSHRFVSKPIDLESLLAVLYATLESPIDRT